MTKSKKQPCPTCGQNIAKRIVPFCGTMLGATVKFYKTYMDLNQYPGYNHGVIRLHEVDCTDPKYKLTQTEYSRANELVRFGILYKEKGMPRGSFGLNVQFIRKFLNNETTVAEYYSRDPVTREVELSESRIYFRQAPSVAEIQKEYGETMTKYIHQPI